MKNKGAPNLVQEFHEIGVDLNTSRLTAPRISTGLPALDLVTGGGFPRRMLTTVWGTEGGGKSTITLYTARELIESTKAAGKPEIVVWFDAERTFDEGYAQSLGVDTDWLVPHRPKKGESAEETLELLLKVANNPNLKSGRVGMIVIDSKDALSTARALEAGMKDSDMGNSPKMWTNFCRKFHAPIDLNDIALVIVSQMRKNIGQMYGDPSTMSGGMALMHMTRLRVRARAAGEIRKGKDVVGTKLEFVITKASVYGATYKGKAEMEFRRKPTAYIDPIPQLVWVGQQLLVLTNAKGEKAGSGYWMLGEHQIAIGQDKVVEAVRGDERLHGKLAISVASAIADRINRQEALPVETDESASDDEELSEQGE